MGQLWDIQGEVALIHHYETDVFALVDFSAAQASERRSLVRPRGDSPTLRISGRVTAVFPAGRLVLVAGTAIR